MNSDQTNARTAGLLLIAAAVAGIMSVVSTKPILDDPEYLLTIAENTDRVITGALLELIMAFACAGIAIWLYPVLKRYDEALALGSVGFRIIEAVFFIVAAICLVSLLPAGREYAQPGDPAGSWHRSLGALLLAIRFWAGQGFGALSFVLGALLYYSIFYTSRLIPRWLSVWGIIAIMLHLAEIVLTMFAVVKPFSAVQAAMNIPVFFQEMVMAAWLIVKGFGSFQHQEAVP